MESKIYYKIEKIKKTPQGYVFYISSSLGTNFELPVSPDQYERFDLEVGEIIDDAHFLKIREEHLLTTLAGTPLRYFPVEKITKKCSQVSS